MEPIFRELKINVHADPIEGLHMADYDFECYFYTYPNKAVKFKKSEMIQVDNDNYLAAITSDMVKTIGQGVLKLRFVAYIPDDDFSDGFRTEVVETCTKERV